jgi:hypothetical protein
MGNVINLNKFRKKKAKEAGKKQAETNRRLHGRTKAERAREALEKKRLDASADHALLQKPTASDDDATSEDDP